MKNSRLVHLVVSLFLVVTLLSSFANTAFAASYPNSASQDYTSDGCEYIAYMNKTANSEHVTPVIETQIYHTSGTESYVGITETHETSWTGSGEITTGYKGIFIDLSTTIGVANSTSHSISVTVAFTIPESRPSGYYRIEHRCPKYIVKELLSDISDNGILPVYQKTLQDMPGLNAGYHVLCNYQ